MGISVFVLCLGLVVPGVFPDPTEMTPMAAITYVQQGGLLSYDLVVQRCNDALPPAIPAYSFGDRVNDVITFGTATDQFFQFEFSITRGINGSRYNLKDGAVRYTQVSVRNLQVSVQITDVNEDAPSFLQTGTITCDLLSNKGVTLYGRSTPGVELTTYDDLAGRLQRGYDVNYVLDWDRCSPESPSTNTRWSGRISGYRFSPTGNIEFTQLVDSAQKELFMIASVSSTDGTVGVKMYSVYRLKRQPSAVETRSCVLGEGYRVFLPESS